MLKDVAVWGVVYIMCRCRRGVQYRIIDTSSIPVRRIVIVVYLVLYIVKYCTLISFRGHLAMYIDDCVHRQLNKQHANEYLLSLIVMIMCIFNCYDYVYRLRAMIYIYMCISICMYVCTYVSIYLSI